MVKKPDVLLPRKFDHPEGLVWDAPRRRLLWVDIYEGEIFAFDPSTKRLDSVRIGQPVGAVAPCPSGELIVAAREGFGRIRADGRYEVMTDPLATTPHIRMNDGAVDARGRFWAGSMAEEPERFPTAGTLFRLDRAGTLSRQLEEIGISNGIGWSPDSSYCYYIDSLTRRLDRFAFDLEEGRLGKRETVVNIPGVYPDGLAVDAEGGIWVALFGGSAVHRFTPAGVVDCTIQLPGVQVTTCAFGGEDLRTLFIAVSAHGLTEAALENQTAGHIFAIDVGVQGLAGNEYGD